MALLPDSPYRRFNPINFQVGLGKPSTFAFGEFALVLQDRSHQESRLPIPHILDVECCAQRGVEDREESDPSRISP